MKSSHGCRFLAAVPVCVLFILCCSPPVRAEVLQASFSAGGSVSSEFSLAFSSASSAKTFGFASSVSLSDAAHVDLRYDSMLRIHDTLTLQLTRLSAICGSRTLRIQPVTVSANQPVLPSGSIVLAQSHWQLASSALSLLHSLDDVAPIDLPADSAVGLPAQLYHEISICGQQNVAGSMHFAAVEAERVLTSVTESLLQNYTNPSTGLFGPPQSGTLLQAVADSFEGTTETVRRSATVQFEPSQP